MKVIMCDVCGVQVAPEDVRYLQYALVGVIPIFPPAASMITIEGHNDCLLPLVAGLKT